MPSQATANRPGLLDRVVEDVILLILTEYCDIKSVVRLGRTCKYLCHLAFLYDVWLSLVAKLVERKIIDVRQPGNESLENLSTNQLIDEVKRIMHGPKTWSHHNSSSVLDKDLNHNRLARGELVRPAFPPASTFPLESRRTVLHPILREVAPGVWDDMTTLLPGGEYVLYLNSGRLECWSISDKCIWMHTCAMDDASVMDFAADFVEKDQVVILTCQSTWNGSRDNFVEITILDLKNAKSKLVLVNRVPDFDHAGMYTSCAVGGKIAVVNMHGPALTTLLINWSTLTYVGLRTSSPRIALIPGYLVFTLDRDVDLVLAVCPLTSFDKYWVPIDGINEPSNCILLEDLPIICAGVHLEQRTGHSRTGHFMARRRKVDLWVCESPIEPGVFRVWVYLSTGDSRAQLGGYQLTVQDSGISWESMVVQHVVAGFPVGMLYSGHRVVNAGRIKSIPQIVPPGPEYDTTRVTPLNLPGCRDFIHVSPYSGAITYSTDEHIVIVHYD
ncbi:hypothetical protein C8F04DRAFT_1114952 [Mycena alexandri]|uniref:F-box domain-containing protein n=1 Tax=Mycena alexandri TaxID=1745969 RepID=A0AAD6WZ74_9AGAR|nr:hypothetical protein C8F04DRAFT_1114952 [Mycena alexandri]